MSNKRRKVDSVGGSAKRQRLTSGGSGLSSRVVIEDLTKRNKRRKIPVGHYYNPGSSIPGPALPVRRDASLVNSSISLPSTSTFNPESIPVVPEDFSNIVFEDILPPQRSRQVR